MKVLVVVNNLGVGGAQKMAKYVYHALSKQYICKILGLYKRSTVEETETIIQLCSTKCSYYYVLKSMRNYLKKDIPDLILAFGTASVVISYIASRGLNIKVVGSERNDPNQLSLPWKLSSRIIYPRCDGFSFQLEEVMSFYKMKPSSTVQVIPNAYLGTIYDSFVKAKDRTNEITCASARIDRQKGLDILLKAFGVVHKRHPDYRLSIYGKVNKSEELNNIIYSLGIEDYVDFKGQTSNLSLSIHSSRCFVLPSRFEGIPNALIEAMASGMPTVSCDCPPGGPRMLTENGTSGLLCSVENFLEMADCITRLIGDDNLCDSLSMEAQKVQKRFEESYISEKWVNLCEETCKA